MYVLSFDNLIDKRTKRVMAAAAAVVWPVSEQEARARQTFLAFLHLFAYEDRSIYTHPSLIQFKQANHTDILYMIHTNPSPSHIQSYY